MTKSAQITSWPIVEVVNTLKLGHFARRLSTFRQYVWVITGCNWVTRDTHPCVLLVLISLGPLQPLSIKLLPRNVWHLWSYYLIWRIYIQEIEQNHWSHILGSKVDNLLLLCWQCLRRIFLCFGNWGEAYTVGWIILRNKCSLWWQEYIGTPRVSNKSNHWWKIEKKM